MSAPWYLGKNIPTIVEPEPQTYEDKGPKRLDKKPKGVAHDSLKFVHDYVLVSLSLLNSCS